MKIVPFAPASRTATPSLLTLRVYDLRRCHRNPKRKQRLSHGCLLGRARVVRLKCLPPCLPCRNREKTICFAKAHDLRGTPRVRDCLLKSVYGLGLGFVIGLVVGGHVVSFIQQPLNRALAEYYRAESQDRVDAEVHRLNRSGEQFRGPRRKSLTASNSRTSSPTRSLLTPPS